MTMTTLAKIPAGIPGITMERNALVIADDATDQALHDLGQRLATMDGALAWWLGDYGIALQKRKGEHYIKGQAVVLGISESYWRHCVSVCRFYEPCCRQHTLSFSHHEVAMQTARATPAPDAQLLATATALITHAQSEGLSVSELRKHGRVTLASPAKYAAEPEANPFASLWEADTWAIRNKTRVFSEREAVHIVDQTRALRGLLTNLERIARDTKLAA